MWKQAFRSYLATLDPKTKSKTKENPKEFILSFIILCIFVRAFSDAGIVQILTRAIPVFLVKWSNLEIGSNMSKAMLLCPMKQEQRKEYIHDMLGLKIGCPWILGMIIEMAWSIAYGFDIQRTILLAIIYISYGIAEVIHIDCIDKMDNKIVAGKKDANGNVTWAWQNFSVSYVAMILLLDYAYTELQGLAGTFDNIISLVGSIYLVIMSIVILCTQYKSMIEETTDYELAFHIPGRLHYIEQE